MDEYEKICLYDSNPYKKCYKAKIKGKDNYVIIKEFNKSKLKLSGDEWNKLENNKNIIKTIDSEESFKIIEELCMMNLEEYVKLRSERLSFNEIQEILNQLNDILKNMNDKQLQYLTLSNTLIVLDKINKISIKLSTNNNSNDFLMKAPEILRDEKDLSKSVLWSLGILLYYLCFNEYPYNGNDENELSTDINSDKQLLQTGDEELNDLMNKLLQNNIEERISWDEYLKHPFFKVKDNKNEIDELNKTKNDLEKELYRLKEKDLSNVFLYMNPSHILDEHKDKVYCLTVLNDGRLVSGSDDNSIIIYNKKDYKPDLIINEHTSWINCLTTLLHGILVSCSKDTTIKLFDIKDNKYEIIQTLNLHSEPVNQLKELDNNSLVSCSDDKTIIFYKDDNDKYKKDYSITTSDWVRNIIPTKINEIVYSTYNERKLYFFDLNEKKNISVIEDIICSHNSDYKITEDLLLIPGLNVINIINIKDRNKKGHIDVESGGMIYGICKLYPNIIITGGEYGILRKWKIEEDNLFLKSKSETIGNDCIFMVLNMKNGHFAACYENNIIKIW